MRSRAQLAAIFASLRGKGPLARAKTLRNKGMASLRRGGVQAHFTKPGMGRASLRGPGGYGINPEWLGLKLQKNKARGGKAYGYFRSK